VNIHEEPPGPVSPRTTGPFMPSEAMTTHEEPPGPVSPRTTGPFIPSVAMTTPTG
jgi:hypothetical protein